MRRTQTFVVVVLAALAGCGDEEAAGESEVSRSEGPAEAPAEPAGEPAEPAGEPAQEPAAARPFGPEYPTEGEIASRLAGLPPVAINPTSRTIGALQLSAQHCVYDGPAFVAIDMSSLYSIGDLAWSTDGSLYVIDNEHRLRRYLVEGGDDRCELHLDREFGENGFFSTGTTMGVRLDSISADEQGHVYVSAGSSGVRRITGRNIDYHCAEVRGGVEVNAAGTEGIAWYASSGQRVHFTDSGCTVEPWTPRAGNLSPPDRDPSEASHVFLAGDRVFVAAVSPTLIRELDLDGAPVGPAFGATDNDGRFCSVSDVAACGSNLCVADGNCKDLYVIDANRSSLGHVDLAALFGLGSGAAPRGVTRVRSGVAYYAIRPDLSRGEGSRQVSEGFIFRVRGLQ